jgi:hypothetical protein
MVCKRKRRRPVAEEPTAGVIRVTREFGKGDWFYATSPDLRGLLCAEPTLDALEKAIPQAITDLYAAKGTRVTVIPLASPRGAYVAITNSELKAHYREPTLATA